MAGASTLADLLSDAAVTSPDRVAVEVDGGRRLTYGHWARRSDALAAGLQGNGVSPGQRLPLVFDRARWCDYALAYIAAQKAAAVPVPVNPELGGIELSRIVRDCGASAIVTPERSRPDVTVPLLHPADLEEQGAGRPPTPCAAAPSMAEILYTSRALAPPVALPRSHRTLLSGPQLVGDLADGTPSLVHAFPVGSLAGQDALVAALSPAPAGSIVVASFEPDRLGALLSAAPGRTCALHPAVAQALLDGDALAGRDLSGVSRLVLTSGRVPSGLLAALADMIPRASLLLVDVLGHGPQGRQPGDLTAGAGTRTVFLHDRRRPQAIGRPHGGTVVWVAGDHGGPAGPGEPGRVWARAADTDRPEDARAARREVEREGVDTGDRGHLDDEGLLYLGADPGPSPDEPAGAPVAFSQEGMLWHEHFAPGCQNLPGLARRYRGPLDVDALARALDEIVRRHAPLRTTFALRAHRVLQRVRPHRPLRLPVHDLTHLADRESAAEVERVVAEAGQRPFDLAADPVFEPALLRLAEDDHVLVIRTHHSVFDDWSVGVFRRELSALYRAFRDGHPSPLPELPLQFPDFARRQRRELAGRAGTRELAFWRRELAGAPLTTQLPVDDPEKPEGSPQPSGEPVSLPLPPPLHEGLQALARAERATVFMTLLAAYGTLVHRYTGQDDLLLATVVANRNRTELEGLIGCFTKKVPLRLRLGGDPPFAEAVRRTRSALMGALAHQDLPFEGVLQDTLGAPAASHGVVPHVVMMFQGETPRHELRLPGVETAGFETSSTARRTHFMAATEDADDARALPEPWGAGLYAGTFVIVSVAETPQGLSCIARGAFHAPAVRKLLDSFRALLEGVAADPTRRLSALPLLDEPQRADVLAHSRGPDAPQPRGTVDAAFAAQVGRDPHAPAVRTRAETLTYAELDARSTHLARHLRALGVTPGATVGVCFDLCADLVAAVVGIWKAGAAWVALDPHDAGHRLADIAGATSLRVVVGDDPRGTIARLARVVTAEAVRATEPSGPAWPPGAAEDAAVVFYGSGPSAVQRGVVLDHRAVLNLRTGLRRQVHPPDPTAPRGPTSLCPHPTSDGFLRQLVGLLDGHTLHLPDRPAAGAPAEAVSLVGAAQVDVLDCAPAELPALLEAGLPAALDARPRGSPRPTLVVGARAPLDPRLWRDLRGLQGAQVTTLYGPPECAFAATATDGGGPRPAGRPLANVRSHVLDAGGRPVPDRAVGELHLGGPSLASRYVGEPDVAPRAFHDGAPDGEATRLHRTGLRARRLPDGAVELLGRVDAHADLRGFRVDPRLVASMLSACPGVGEVAVTLHRDEGGDPRLVAHVTPKGQPPTLAELRACLWARLPGYACPSAVIVLPATRAQGRAGGAAPKPEPEAAGRRPPDAHETVLSALWAEVLGVDGVVPTRNYWQQFSFFEVLARARDAGLTVAAERVVRNRTVQALAADMAAARPAPPAEPARRSEDPSQS